MQHNTPQSNRGNTHGQALVPVILVMLIFTILALSFAGSASREIRASANYMHTVEKSLAAKGAVNYAMAALAQTSKNGATYGVVPPSGDTDSNGWRKMGDAKRSGRKKENEKDSRIIF